MDDFAYQGGVLHCEKVALPQVARTSATPTFVYSRATLLRHYHGIVSAFAAVDPQVCFSVKSCPNIHLLRLLKEAGSGFDVVSGGELHRALRAGADPKKIVFAGVGKSDDEIRMAIRAKVGLLNAESESEMERITALAQEAGAVVNVALRVNPDVWGGMHAYTTTGTRYGKFGVNVEEAAGFFERFSSHRHVALRGVHIHIGSPIKDLEAYRKAVQRAVELIGTLREQGFQIDTFDLGGGLGAHYEGSEAAPAHEYAAAAVPLLEGSGLRIILEPGRSIAANAGLLLTRVLHVKKSAGKTFVIVDASMNELIRPALYGAYHFIWPVEAEGRVPINRGADQPFDDLAACDVVGPICESSDFLAKDRRLPAVRRGDLLAVFAAGAYGIAMSSQYNSRPRAAEVLVEDDSLRLIRRRETYDDLIAAELDASQ